MTSQLRLSFSKVHVLCAEPELMIAGSIYTYETADSCVDCNCCNFPMKICSVMKYKTLLALSTILLFQTQINITLAEAQFSVHIHFENHLLCTTAVMEAGLWPVNETA